MNIYCNDTGELIHSYREYLKSKHWNILKAKYYDGTGQECFFCGSSKNLQIHHKHYRTLGNERLSDLLCLCGECHRRVHDAAGGADTSHLFKKVDISKEERKARKEEKRRAKKEEKKKRKENQLAWKEKEKSMVLGSVQVVKVDLSKYKKYK